jgi:SAM-dependent methyltransferase
MVDRQLLRAYLRTSPAQPATALWRSIELKHLIESGAVPLEGHGLDLGCGDGRLAQVLRDALNANWHLVGVDADPKEVAMARELAMYESVREAEGSATGLPPNSFDFVFSNSVLEHVDAFRETLLEVSRVLKPGGRFIYTVPSEFFPENLGEPKVVGRLATGVRDTMAYRREIDRRLAHRHYLTVDGWRAELSAVALELVRSSYYMTVAETRRWALISNATAGFAVRIGGGRSSPIEIQRTLRLRGTTPPLLLRGVGRMVAELGALGLHPHSKDNGRGSCLLVVAHKLGEH